MADKRKVSVLAVPVGQEPEVRLLHNNLESLQEFVGGQICAQGIAPRLWLYANDDALRLGLPYNRCGFVGNLLIAKVSSAGNGIAMTDKDVATAKDWLARNDHRPPLCHVCGRLIGENTASWPALSRLPFSSDGHDSPGWMCGRWPRRSPA